MLSFTQYNQYVTLVKCSTIVSNRFTRLSFNIMRGSNRRLPSALRPTGGDSYVVCLSYVVRQLSSIKLDLPEVVNRCFPTQCMLCEDTDEGKSYRTKRKKVSHLILHGFPKFLRRAIGVKSPNNEESEFLSFFKERGIST